MNLLLVLLLSFSFATFSQDMEGEPSSSQDLSKEEILSNKNRNDFYATGSLGVAVGAVFLALGLDQHFSINEITQKAEAYKPNTDPKKFMLSQDEIIRWSRYGQEVEEAERKVKKLSLLRNLNLVSGGISILAGAAVIASTSQMATIISDTPTKREQEYEELKKQKAIEN